MKKQVLLFALLLSFCGFSQFGPVNVVDNSTASQGIKRIIVADLNNDNLDELIVAQAYNVNHISYYSNSGNGTFGTKTVIDSSTSYPVSVVAGDLNADGFMDLATVGQTYGEVVVYLNDGNAHFTRHEIDSANSFLNGLVMEDFDHNGAKDLVVIGQHSIDLYRNNGSAVFTKEHILTTSTSPNVLECMHIETADMNNDGHPDVLTGETIGGVIYYNDGTGTFTPQTIHTPPLISPMIQVLDFNNDELKDVVLQSSNGDVKLYENTGTGTFELKGTLFTIPNMLTSMESVDANGDGYLDLYYAHTGKVRMLFNNGDETFGNETYLYENSSFFTNEVAVANLDAASEPEFIWSAVGGTIAYHKSTVLGIPGLNTPELQIYPNPTSDLIHIESTGTIIEMHLFTSQGQKIALQSDLSSVDLSGLASGSYILEVVGEHVTVKRKIFKQ